MPTEPDNQAIDLAMKHIFDEPVGVELSNGETVEVWSVTPRVMFEIAEQIERLRFALQQYQAFEKAAEDPANRVWEHGRRLPFWSKRWLDALEICCELILTKAVINKIKSPFRFWKRFQVHRQVNRTLGRASCNDWVKIVGKYREMHDVERLAEAIFGPPKTPSEEKKTSPPSGLPSLPRPSGSIESPSTRPIESSIPSPGGA